MNRQYRFTPGFMAVLLVAVLLLIPAAAFAAEPETPAATTEQKPIWDDLSYSKFLLRNTAFYELNEGVLKAESMEELIKALRQTDPWAQYFPAEQYAYSLEDVVGDFVGIGVYLRGEEQRTVVMGTIAGGPAEKAGLKNGDYIVEVDGKSTRNATPNELQALLRGEENTLVTLKYERNGKTTELIMSRKRIVEPSMEYWLMDDGVGYLLIEKFTRHTGEELANAIKSLKKQGMTTLIVDLRNCPGGEIDGAIEVCGILCGEGPVLFFVDKNGWQGYAPIDWTEQLNLPLAVLINGNTASSAELVAANVQDAQTGVLIGETSYGKGVVQTMRGLPSGGGISFTTDKYISRSYQDIDSAGGILPDIYVKDADEQRERAISWLKEQLAAPSFVKYYAGLNGYALGNTWHDGASTLTISEGSSYVPLLLTLTNLGWQTEQRDGLLYAEGNGWRLIVDEANALLITNGGEQQLLARDSTLYAPASLLRDYGYTVTWSEAERSVKIGK